MPRPNAFSVSFGEEADDSTSLTNSSRSVTRDNSPFARPLHSGSSSTARPSSSRSNTLFSQSRKSTPTGNRPGGSNVQHQRLESRPPVPPNPWNGRQNVTPSLQRGTSSSTSGTVNAGEKRKNSARDEVNLHAPEKRPRSVQSTHTRASRYKPHDHEIQESKQTIVFGEDVNDTRKPVRFLFKFEVYDHLRSEMAPLFSLDPNGIAQDIHLRALGLVAPILDEEDEGQEEDVLEDDDWRGATQRLERYTQRLRTTDILGFHVNYRISDGPLTIETEHAFYVLKNPVPEYRKAWRSFYRPHRMTQLIISWVLNNRSATYAQFTREHVGRYDETLGEWMIEDMFKSEDTLQALLDALRSRTYQLAVDSVVIKTVFEGYAEFDAIERAFVNAKARGHKFEEAARISPGGDLDHTLLYRENQQRTHVTSLIGKLSDGYFHENLVVVGPRPTLKEDMIGPREVAKRLQHFLREALLQPKYVSFPTYERRLGDFGRDVSIEGKTYEVGDVVLVPAGKYEGRETLEIPSAHMSIIEIQKKSLTLANFFWFGRIVYINRVRGLVHLRWFEHSSTTLMQEISDPKELFLTNICDDVDLKLIVGKVNVSYWIPVSDAQQREVEYLGFKATDFFYSFIYNQQDGSYTQADKSQEDLCKTMDPPLNCEACQRSEMLEESSIPRVTVDGNGFIYQSTSYHINDFVLVKSDEGACAIGQIINIKFRRHDSLTDSKPITLRLLGRICDIAKILPKEIVKDERHLFLTDEVSYIMTDRILGRCRVVNAQAYPQLDYYLAQAPTNFYVRYHFPTSNVQNWRDHIELNDVRIPEVCGPCFHEDEVKEKKARDFLQAYERKPLRGFDPFAGVGAFGLGMQESGCLKMTHCIELMPSAALTLEKNSPETIVYNQCSNIVLQYAVKTLSGHKPKPPRAYRDNAPLPAPPKPGDIDCVVAGFPCQSHSDLNMFKQANERKSHLILNLLSWVDFLRPRYCFFENVHGFTRFRLNTVQAGRHRVEGGIPNGGLKFLVRALLAMGFQCRFALLQAGHYGAPQTRIRFFLIAARIGFPLPEFPKPTHHFPKKHAMLIKFPYGNDISMINSEPGTSPFNFVSVDDAIGDLYRFHWLNLRDPHEKPSQRIISCDRSESFCGIKQVKYEHEPRTSFQVKCRAKENQIQDLQHYTRIFPVNTVKRVVAIPLKAGADYRSLPSDLWEWQFSNPLSAVARDGFRSGLYGRLDEKGWFNATVTNVAPTAKQSRVLNPYCKRILTIRELARSQGFPDHFRFYSIKDDGIILQREIGNAVSWQVAEALGRQLRQAEFTYWTEGRRSVEAFEEGDDRMDLDGPEVIVID